MLVPPLSSDIGAKNSRLGDRIRKVAAGPRLCKIFCGGAACKYCDHQRWVKANQAIEGVSLNASGVRHDATHRTPFRLG